MIEIKIENNALQQQIAAAFGEFTKQHDREPRLAHCRIEWKDDHQTCEVEIKLSSDVVEQEDDDIFYYCDSLNDLLALCQPGMEDFVITEFFDFE